MHDPATHLRRVIWSPIDQLSSTEPSNANLRAIYLSLEHALAHYLEPNLLSFAALHPSEPIGASSPRGRGGPAAAAARGGRLRGSGLQLPRVHRGDAARLATGFAPCAPRGRRAGGIFNSASVWPGRCGSGRNGWNHITSHHRFAAAAAVAADFLCGQSAWSRKVLRKRPASYLM